MVQTDSPFDGATLPAAQFVQVDSDKNFPAVQIIEAHTDAPLNEVRPTAHEVHTEALSAE